MTAPRITLLASQDRLLREHFVQGVEGHERAAVVLFKRVETTFGGLSDSDRYIAVAAYPIEDSWITGSSSSHVAFEMRGLRESFRRCEEQDLVFGFAHNHPNGLDEFSEVDDANELTLLTAICNRNGPNLSLVGLLWNTTTWRARVRRASSPAQPIHARHVAVTDRPLRISCADNLTPASDVQARQEAAFGTPFIRKLGSLRAAVVGLGGTGSPTATLLARAGVGELVLIDPDRLEMSNLNRVRGASRDDVGEFKAEVLAKFIRGLGLPTLVTALPVRVDSPEGVDALASCDVVFGCTDDQVGRELLNTAAYAYALPYIDVGLGGALGVGGDGQPYLRYHHGRISTLLPEAGECLFCQGVLTEQWIRRDYALRETPDLDEAQARERYLEGGAEAAPGVGPFTSAVADFGVATLFDLVSPFRRFPSELRWDAFSIDFVKMQFQSARERSNLHCPYCRSRDFLGLQEQYRLNRPSLGKRHVAL